MAIKRPTPSQFRAVAHDLGMTLTDDDLRSYLELMAASFGAYDAMEAMPDYLPEVKYPRTPGYQPDGAENPVQRFSGMGVDHRPAYRRLLAAEPLEFLERLAAMTPRPETNLLICHGVLAPRARWRGQVVVYGRRMPEPTASTARLTAGSDGTGVKTASPRAWTWAALMHRAFGIDVLACAQCGGRLRLIATLYDPTVIRKILAHLPLCHSGQRPGLAPRESGAAAS
jgi:hypothetical protein